MPLDKKGRFHMNTQRAMASDKMGDGPNKHKQSGEGAKGVSDPMPGGADESDLNGDSTRTVITHNDDGTHSVMHHDGEETGPHDLIEDAMEVIRAKHGEGGMAHGGGLMHGGGHHMAEQGLSGL